MRLAPFAVAYSGVHIAPMAVEPSAQAQAGPSLSSVASRLSRRFKIKGLLPWGETVPYFRADSEVGPIAIAALPFECRTTTKADRAFYRLTRRLASISGAGLPILVASGVEETVPFVAFKQPNGRLLATHLGEGRVPGNILIPIADTILFALSKSHSSGLLHGEIAPEAVLVDERVDARVGVTLLGVGFAPAVHETREREERSSGFAPARSYYRAPEVLAGEPVSVASDVYAVGALLHHMISGRPPGVGDSDEAYADAPALLDVVRRAMAQDPGARYPTVDSMRGALSWVDVRSDRLDASRQDIPLWMESSTVADIPVTELIRATVPPPAEPSKSLPPLAASLTNASIRRSSPPSIGFQLPPESSRPPARGSEPPAPWPPVSATPWPPPRPSSVPPPANTGRISSVPPPIMPTIASRPTLPPPRVPTMSSMSPVPSRAAIPAVHTSPRISLPPPPAPLGPSSTRSSTRPPAAWALEPMPLPVKLPTDPGVPRGVSFAMPDEIEVEVDLDDEDEITRSGSHTPRFHAALVIVTGILVGGLLALVAAR